MNGPAAAVGVPSSIHRSAFVMHHYAMTSLTPIAGVMRMERGSGRCASRRQPGRPGKHAAGLRGGRAAGRQHGRARLSAHGRWRAGRFSRRRAGSFDRCARPLGGEKIPLASKTLAELETLDAGSWFGPAFAGTRIPTLEAAIDTILTGSLALIERKAGDAATLVELANRKRCVGRIAVMAFDWDFLRECRQLSQTLVLARSASTTSSRGNWTRCNPLAPRLPAGTTSI